MREFPAPIGAVWSVFGKAYDDGEWHFAENTYPSTMDTVCGRKNIYAMKFFAGPGDRPPDLFFERVKVCDRCKKEVLDRQG